MKQNMIVFTSSFNYRTTAGIASKTKDIKLLEETPRREYTRLALNEVGHHLIGLLIRITWQGNW